MVFVPKTMGWVVNKPYYYISIANIYVTRNFPDKGKLKRHHSKICVKEIEEMQLKWNYTFSQPCVATDLKPADSTTHRLKVFEKITAAVQLPSLSDVA